MSQAYSTAKVSDKKGRLFSRPFVSEHVVVQPLLWRGVTRSQPYIQCDGGSTPYFAGIASILVATRS